MDAMIDSVLQMASPSLIGLVAIGTMLGVIVGAIPGMTGAMVIALSLPLTYQMQPNQAMALLVAMYVGSVSGGLVSATLLRMPGTPASVMTTLDGYPLALAGKPERALGLGICASFIGGLVSWFCLVLLAEPVALLSTKLGPFEMFSLVMAALVLIAAVVGDSLVRGLLSGMLGVLVSMPGASRATGELRWTFGIAEMNDGFKLLPVLIGMFAINQVIQEATRSNAQAKKIEPGRVLALMNWRDLKRQCVNLFRSSFLGTWIGVLPGVGANIGSVVAYSAAKSSSKTPEEFGKGSEEGIVASESANNATVGGALIPLIAMGIPGSVIDAILLGALVVHGLQPGPLLFTQNPDAVHTFMGSMLLANVLMFAFMVISVRWLAKLMTCQRAMLMPIVIVCCVIGSFALANRMFDVWVMLAFGAVGFVMEKLRIPLAPFVIGLILAPEAEKHLAAGLTLSDGSYMPLVTRPIALVFCLIALALVVFSVTRHMRAAKASR